MDKEAGNTGPDDSLKPASTDFEAAARTLSNLDIENINLRPWTLRRKLRADFKLNPQEIEELVKLFARRKTRGEKE
ncbi:MAG: hypothetical protein M1575_02075 [Patescibacteria group bacterium]|nr:hypothetical protein [Patescibacteria group bacterium]